MKQSVIDSGIGTAFCFPHTEDLGGGNHQWGRQIYMGRKNWDFQAI